MTRVPEDRDPMDLSEAPITGGHPARELPANTRFVIVGSGFAGLCMAIKLKQAGHHDFVILEKGDDVGGTWRENTYPGAACDIQSHLYSFSFELNPKWSRMFARQPEILDYLRHCVREYELEDHLYFGVRFDSGTWDDAARRWRVKLGGAGVGGGTGTGTGTGNGTGTGTGTTELTADFVVLGMGPLHRPLLPNVPGIADFQGPSWHSAEWRHDVDLTGKRVAVIGTGASAIQFVPRVAEQAAQVVLFQRTPAWIMPKRDRHISGPTKALYRNLPGFQRAHRTLIYWTAESRAMGFVNPKFMKVAEGVANAHRKRQVRDPDLARRLKPDYTMGCKRVLISNDFYPALGRDHVTLVDQGVKEIRGNSVVAADGTEHEVDVIIYGTGFHVTDAFDAIDMVGPAGRSLKQDWSGGLAAYYGMTVAGFPNMFILVGPNTGLGHNSIVFMIEAQTAYLMKLLALARERGAATVAPTERAQRRFNEGIHRALATQVWSAGGCQSWYLDENGRNTTIWPGFTWRYWSRTRKPDQSAYCFER
ncbi:NAD(P)/FAD-dependent oxidoreductase [Catenulispora yoronensis]|uniref:NAD(P)/FAD-dependent oxidoreductase n=1 Tax=Catenulispora yoronensis TaxID=450799 RepID=A0ABN2URY3_9ACTN